MADLELKELIREALIERVKGAYAQAETLFERAVTKFPSSPEAHRYLAQTVSYRAAASGLTGSEKEAALARAEDLIRKAEALQGGRSPDTLHDTAWIADERQDYALAARLYREAIALAREEGRRDNPVIGYNLACALVKDHREDEALAVLQGLGDDPKMVEAMKNDPDFESLRGTPAFRELVAPA